MIPAIFLTAALSLPGANYTRPPIVSVQAIKSEEDQLKDWIKKKGDFEEVFIHDNPQEDKLKEYGWERVPYTWKGKGIWGRRRPKSDQKLREAA